MERQSYGQEDPKMLQRLEVRTDERPYNIQVANKEIIIFENSQNEHIGNNAYEQKKFSPFSGISGNHDAGQIIHHDGEKEYKNVFWDESCIENAAG